jgi:dolichol-phosphate mannosyltransferase
MGFNELEKTAVIAIPSFNCGPQIRRVLEALAASGFNSMNVWVIDNGSSDATVSNAIEAKRILPGLRVFVNAENVNLGGTHKIAFQQAQEQGFRHVVILHGDDQADPKDIKELLRTSAKSDGASVLGARFMKESRLRGYDWKRVLGNRILNQIYSAFAARRLYDLGSGLNLFRLSDLDPKTFLGFGNTITFNYQLILDLVRRGVPFAFHPIAWKEEDQISNARNVHVFMTALSILAKWFFIRNKMPPEPFEQTNSWKEVI